MRWLVTTLVVCALAYEDDHSHTILRVQPETVDHMDTLRNMEDHLGFEVDYLRKVRSVKRPGDIVLPKGQLAPMRHYLNKRGVPNWIIEDNINLKRDRRAVLENVDPSAAMTKEMITSGYLPFDTQIRVMRQLAASYPRIVRLEQIGTSTEQRPILIATVGYRCNQSKPILWIDSGIHAREWIAPSAALYALWELVTDPAHTSLLKRVDVIIAPNVNPDGYEFSRNHERLWRKTRSRVANSGCLGVDGNRNYNFHWGEEGVSPQPCSEVFCGQTVLSEPEVRALTRRITSLKDRIKGYIALHSYGEDILYPWGHAVNQYPPDVEELITVANEMAAAIKSVDGTVYSVNNSAGGLYPASGASDDWAKSIGVKYSYTIELSPKNDYFGFELPERFIKQTTTEVFAGLHALALRVAQEPVERRFKSRIRG